MHKAMTRIGTGPQQHTQSSVAFILIGSSGSGKSAIRSQAIRRDPTLYFATSHTTRAPRPDEKPGYDYHFITEAEFDRIAARGDFIETTRYQNHRYGTHRSAVNVPMRYGLDLVLELDPLGALQLQNHWPQSTIILILPPDPTTLRSRLHSRRPAPTDDLDRRATSFSTRPPHDFCIINNDLDTAVNDFLSIVNHIRRHPRGSTLVPCLDSPKKRNPLHTNV